MERLFPLWLGLFVVLNLPATFATDEFSIVRERAEKGDAVDQYLLGRCYTTGNGVTKDPLEALKWYRKAAEQGHVDAQYGLGIIYTFGEGVTRDSSEAVKWYRKAAEQGHVQAQVSLAFHYSSGNGVPQDFVEAVKWYRIAAEQGDTNAQYHLGFSYLYGRGILKDEIEALAWLNLCAISGEAENVAFRDRTERDFDPRLVQRSRERSKELLRQIEANKSGNKGGNVTKSPLAKPENPGPIASGTGSIISPSGYILTAAHVVEGAKKIEVVTSQGAKTATLVRLDESNDLAVLKIETENITSLPIAPSRQVRLGQSVATVGFPHIQLQGFSPKVTKGEISSLNGAGDDPRNWQISVPVQSGNSGGPLLDENGNLVGVIISKLGLRAAAATGDLPQNVSYAVKSAYALPLLEPYLGNDTPEPNKQGQKPSFEDMVASAQKAVVLILVY